MISEFEALIALKQHGTMTRAALALRITQSAVSKRIHLLQDKVGRSLIETKGRYVELTPEALALIDQALPLLNDLNEVLNQAPQKWQKAVVVGVSESVLSSWGPKVLKPWMTGGRIELHCHRSPIIQQKVESGIFDLGICAGPIKRGSSLLVWPWIKEEMVLAKRGAKSKGALFTIEPTSTTWMALQKDLKQRGMVEFSHLQSFAAIVQIVRSGCGEGLVPRGVATHLGLKQTELRSLKPRLYRPIQLVMKKSRWQNPSCKKIVEEILDLKDFGF